MTSTISIIFSPWTRSFCVFLCLFWNVKRFLCMMKFKQQPVNVWWIEKKANFDASPNELNAKTQEIKKIFCRKTETKKIPTTLLAVKNFFCLHFCYLHRDREKCFMLRKYNKVIYDALWMGRQIEWRWRPENVVYLDLSKFVCFFFNFALIFFFV